MLSSLGVVLHGIEVLLLEGPFLYGVYPSEANLAGADLEGAHLYGADLRGVALPDGTVHE